MNRVLFAAMVAAIAANSAGATTIVDQSAGPFISGMDSDVGFATAYDDFMLPEAASVTHVTWWGFSFGQAYFNTQDTFTIAFYNTDPVSGNADPTSTIYMADVQSEGVIVDDATDKFEADLPLPALLPKATPIWISIVAHMDNGYLFEWREISGPAPLPAFDDWDYSEAFSNGEWIGSYNNAFKLDGEIVASPSPEPISWMLMLGGFGAVGATLRHRKRGTSIAIG